MQLSRSHDKSIIAVISAVIHQLTNSYVMGAVAYCFKLRTDLRAKRHELSSQLESHHR